MDLFPEHGWRHPNSSLSLCKDEARIANSNLHAARGATPARPAQHIAAMAIRRFSISVGTITGALLLEILAYQALLVVAWREILSPILVPLGMPLSHQ
jgi:hypothetical protein